MGEKLKVRPGAEIVVSIVVRDPAGPNYSPYSFLNPSLLQVGINQPMNMPVLDHIDLIRGTVSGFKAPGAADYSGEWPRNTAWLADDGSTASLAVVPDAAKNTTTGILRTFNGSGASPWVVTAAAPDGSTFLKMTYRIPAVTASQYVRLRGTNLPAAVPFETDGNGNPLADLFTNANDPTKLMIPCTTVGSNVPGQRPQRQFELDPGEWPDRRLPEPPGDCRRSQPDRGPESGVVRRRRLGRPVVLQQSDLRRGRQFDSDRRRPVMIFRSIPVGRPVPQGVGYRREVAPTLP